MLAPSKQEKIAHEVIRTLISRFDNFPTDSANNRNAPFHLAFLNAFADKLEGKVPNIPFFISLSSWLHGLSTTLGQSFFESIAHILSDGEKKGFTKGEGSLLKVTNQQKIAVANIMTDLKNGNRTPNLGYENHLIFNTATQGSDEDANSFTADVFIEDTNQITAIELKTVKPNAGVMRGEKQKILEAKAALIKAFPNAEIQYYIGFPFDPTSDTPTGADKIRFLDSIIDGKKYFAPDEVLLASELWDFLSGDLKTMEQILEIINSIATTDFMAKFNFLNKSANRRKGTHQYKKMLQDWFLFSEVELVSKDPIIIKKLNDRSATRIYNQSVFKKENSSYKYNSARYHFLIDLID